MARTRGPRFSWTPGQVGRHRFCALQCADNVSHVRWVYNVPCRDLWLSRSVYHTERPPPDRRPRLDVVRLGRASSSPACTWH